MTAFNLAHATEFGDSGTESRSRLSLRAYGLPLLPVIIALVGWYTSLMIVDVEAVQDSGLISVLKPGYFVALGLLTISFAVSVHRQMTSPLVVVLHIIALIVIIHGTTVVLYDAPRYSWTYKHVGVAEFIQRRGIVDASVDIYNNWPGFFGLVAMFSQLAGFESALPFAEYAQLFFNLLWAGPLYLIFKACTSDQRLIWTALWFFFMTNWPGQDYFSPQAMAYFFNLVIIAICLTWFRKPDLPPRRWVQRIIRSPRLTSLYFWIVSRPSIDETTVDMSRAQRGLLMGIAILSFVAIVSSHQLTPFMLAAALIALVVFQRLSARTLPLLLLILTATWLLYLARPYFELTGDELFDSLSTFSLEFSERVTLRTVSDGVVLVGIAVRGLVLVFWVLGFLGGIRRLHHGYWDLAMGILFIAPFPMRLLQSYGGEMIFRVYFFAAPFCAFFAASLFYPSLWAGRSRWTMVFKVAASFALSMLLVITYYGQERANHIRSDEVAAFEYVYQRGDKFSALVAPVSLAPALIDNYEYFTHYWFMQWEDYTERDLGADEIEQVTDLLSLPQFTNGYLVFTTSMHEYVNLDGEGPRDTTRRFEQMILDSPEFKLVYSTPHARVFTLVDRS